MTKKTVALFTYAFPHQKSQDFILELFVNSVFELIVIAAPWKVLESSPSEKNTFQSPKLFDPEILCRALGIHYHIVSHDDFNEISTLKSKHLFKMGIIAGARILKPNIIDLFDEGVFNLHPGKLPETSGLNAFEYAIEKKICMGVTGHFIDPRVDAGQEVFFLEVPPLIGDSPHSLKARIYEQQLAGLRKFVSMHVADALVVRNVDWKSKNRRMKPDEISRTMNKFPEWMEDQLNPKIAQKLFAICEGKEQKDSVSSILRQHPILLETRSPEGWTPLIVASYNQNISVVEELIALGADVNAVGRNGTTVLMYAKTALLQKQDSDYRLLNLLIKAGADLEKQDNFGKKLQHYVLKFGDEKMLHWLSNLKGRSI